MKPIIYLVIVSSLLLSCHQQKENNWSELDCGLFKNTKGEVSFATQPTVANIPDSLLDPEQCSNTFITHIAFDSTQLINVIDTSTFEKLGTTFYRDKKNIYYHYKMCDGGYLSILKNDTAHFKILGDCYAKDDQFIYYMTAAKIENVDYKSFTSRKGWGPFAKDKNQYYALGSIIPEKDYHFYQLDTLR